MCLALIFMGVFSFLAVDRLQGNAKVINYAGVVRGATQRLVKEELQGYPNDELIARLDRIIEELLTGEGELGLIRMEDVGFQSLMSQQKKVWQEIKEEIENVRQGANKKQLYRLSESYFELADRTVTAAELYSESNVRMVEKGFVILTGFIIAVTGVLIWLVSVQDKRKRAIQKAEEENRKKSERLSQMSKELQAPVNEVSELIYVSDMENYDLLFINEAGKKSFQVDDISGRKCYEVIQGRTEPCPFCTNPMLSRDENYNWEITNPVTNCHYMLKDRIVEWDGRKARLEIAFDMTQMENEKLRLQHALDAENMVTECIRILYQGRNMEQDLPVVLKHVGEFLQGERTYILRLSGDKIYNEFEWCAPGVHSKMKSLDGMSISVFKRWMPMLKKQEFIVVKELEAYKESSPQEYEFLKKEGIQRLVVAPMERDGVLVGCLGVDNPPLEKQQNIGPLLQSLCYFILLAYRRAENERMLSHLSYHDTLTSFYNRNRYIQDLAVLSMERQPLGIVFLDVNGLKGINDRFGHARGDEILMETADKIQKVFAGADCYRVGGDEFVVICRHMPKIEFEDNVERLKRSFRWDDSCHAAIGTKWTDGVQDVQQIIAAADAGMYEDKKEFYRKNRSVNRYRRHSDDILKLEDASVLQEEISRGRFIVYFQPKVSAGGCQIQGAEALIRYQAEDGTLVLPGDFLPVLEESKTIRQVDSFVFEFVCSKLRDWMKAGKKVMPVSVNFSRYSLVQPSFIGQLEDVCQKYGIDASYLEIEITESVRDVDGLDLNDLMVGLRRAGFAVAIDDFGKEYANLALLSEVDFDVLKLDRSVVKHVDRNSKAKAIIEAIADICNKTGTKLVAEGIEGEAQLEAVRACGVETVQGYLFGRPMPVEEYEKQYV